MAEIKSTGQIPKDTNIIVYKAPKIYHYNEYDDEENIKYGKIIIIKYENDTITISCDGSKKYFKNLVRLIANKPTVYIDKTPDQMVITIPNMDRNKWLILIKSIISDSNNF